MVIIDDVLLFPVRGLLFIFQEIHKAVLEESKNEAEAIRSELGRLYLLLESGQLTEGAFDQREKELLDRLDKLETDSHEADDQTEGEGEYEDAEIEDDDAKDVDMDDADDAHLTD